MSRQAKANIIATVIAAMAFVVLGIAYSRGGLIMIYVFPFILALCGWRCGTSGSGKPRRRPKFTSGPSNCAPRARRTAGGWATRA